jgi:hypothetical protein
LDHPRNNENTAALDVSALMLGASGTCRLAFSLRGAITIDLQAFDGPQEFSVSIYYNTTMQSVLNGVFNKIHDTDKKVGAATYQRDWILVDAKKGPIIKPRWVTRLHVGRSPAFISPQTD